MEKSGNREDQEFLDKKENAPEREKIAIENVKDKIDIIILPTLQELCEQEHTEPEKLHVIVQEKIQNVLEKVSKTSCSNELSEDLLFVYKCANALEQMQLTDDDDGLKKLKDSLSSFAEVRKNYFGDFKLDSYQMAIWKGWVTRAMSEINTSERLKITKKQEGRRKYRQRIYLNPADVNRPAWIKYADTDHSTTFITERVMQDIEGLKKEGLDLHMPGYFHATSSSMLEGLKNQQALLSRHKLKERGQVTHSGEGADFDPRVYVYGSFHNGAQYSDIAWFDEYPITFLINRKKADTMKTKTGDRNAPDHGISLGHEVPIQYIEKMFVPGKNFDEANEWSRKHAPWIAVHTIEAQYCK